MRNPPVISPIREACDAVFGVHLAIGEAWDAVFGIHLAIGEDDSNPQRSLRHRLSSTFSATSFWHSFDSSIHRGQLPSVFYFSLAEISVVNSMTSVFCLH
ncbi:hypothetical protein PVL29_011633 [Vitis rotundifolia]|uniref:Uncharacterized protein n=1 Tax=Vitis rotundifolia TaxID=103349 RepID=A0AA39DSJ7_VITRO|nr:hypothetical protein PVL29_011633 [Vitis rotundifolia]